MVHHDYVDAPLAPQSEDWRLVSFPHPDYAFMMWSVRHRIEVLKWPAKLKFKSKVWSLTRSGLCRWNCYKQASHCQGPASSGVVLALSEALVSIVAFDISSDLQQSS